MPTSRDHQLASKRCVVMGLGRFGGGAGVTRYLCSQQAHVLVTDKEPEEKLAASIAQLRDLVEAGRVTLRLGEHRDEDFREADLVVVNPAVDPRANPYLQAAAAAGVPLTSEIRLLVGALPDRGRTIGITGSAGKSTTTAMIGHALTKLLPPPRRVHVGGNLGGSLLGQLRHIGPQDWVVLELSSFMLEGLSEDAWSPHIAVVTNLAPNHVDRHGSFEGVIAAKQGILEHQTMDDLCILPPDVAARMRPRCPQVFLREEELCVQLAIPGAHNIANARLAVASIAATGVASPQAGADALGDFPGLPHRLELVHERDGVCYFNDSKSTTPESAILAIESFPVGVVHVILGGYDKHSDLSGVARLAARRCYGVYTIGKTGDAIADAAESAPDRVAEIVRCGDLSSALTQIRPRLRPGDAVLLSPACASWDQFENFEQRGAAFAAAVRDE